MPNYRTHTAIGFGVLAASAHAALSHYHLPVKLVTISSISFAVATLFLSPDLDLKHSSPTRNWRFLKGLWRPYQMMSRHRGWSHSIFLSTALRMLYLSSLLFLTYLSLGYLLAELKRHGLITVTIKDPAEYLFSSTGEAQRALNKILPEIAAAGVGIWLSDVCHIITDRSLSAWRAFTR